jgi:hypothetical protein
MCIASLSTPNVGKLIDVSGDVYNGFEYQFTRNHSLGETTRKHVVIPIGEVDDDHVADTVSNEPDSTDKIPHGQFEQIALTIPGPGPTMNSASGNAVDVDSLRFHI